MKNTSSARPKVYEAAERLAACIGVLLALPVGVICAVAILLEDGLPVFFRQERIGFGGVPFRLWKFRSMRRDNRGLELTASGDSRVTRVGRVLRKYKLDELPQLWNVVFGDMSLIGPRPEVRRYVDQENPLWLATLAMKPGVTDLATLVYRNEEEMLAGAANPDDYYRTSVLPEKLALNLRYHERRNLSADVRLLALTVRYSFRPAGFSREKILKLMIPESRKSQ